jgi:hypothetical protein
MTAASNGEKFFYGQRVTLVDEEGETGLVGRVVGPTQMGHDENGPTILVYISDPGNTAYPMGVQLLYVRRLRALEE